MTTFGAWQTRRMTGTTTLERARDGALTLVAGMIQGVGILVA
jgi:hypothetical protein